MSNPTGRKPTPEQLEEMRQAQAQAQDTFINQNTALPMPQEGNKIPIEGGGYTWIDPQLANKPIPEAPEGRELTMDDMLTDQKTFEYFKKKGAFDSDQPWYEMLYEGGKAMVSDSYDWMSSLGWRTASNLLIFDWFGDGPLAQASKTIKAKARATTLQTIGDIGLNYEQLGQGASRLMDKLVMKEGSHEDNKSSYEFWKGINEIEKRRQTAAAELATSDFLMMGGDPEIRRMIREGEVKPDYKASMGASIWADPLNYISIGAGYKALRGGANTAFNGAETAMLKELQDAYVFQAQLKEVAKINPSKKVSDTIDVMDGFIGENLDKLNKIAPKRDIALRQLAESLPQGHQLRDQIEEALTGIPIKAKSNITSKLTGSGMIATGKAVEITGSILNLASRLPQETAINFLMRLGVKEETAMQVAKSSAFQLGMGGTATYGVASMLTDDELLQLSAVTAVIAPQLLRTYGRDFAKMGAELMQPETILPYWKRLASRGSETLTERTIDRTQWFPVRSVAEQITGAGQGKVGQRIASPFTKNPNNKLGIGLKNEPLGSTGSGGLYDLANALDKSKAGRYLELGGRMTDATVKGGAVGGVFGYIAGGGEQDEALYGGIGAGGLLGLGGGGIGGYGRFRGNLSPTELIQARYGNHQYYTKNLLPAMQKENFNLLRKDVQIAVASTAMSYPNLQIEYYRGGKTGVGGEQGINKEGVPYIKVNVDSPRAIEPVIKHELSHYIEEIGGTTPFNDMLIGNPILGLKGYFTKLDDNGDPVKRRDGSFETTQKFEDLKFDYFSKFDEYEALYLQSVKSAKAHGANEINARDYAKRRVLQKVNQLKDNRTGAFIADQLTVRELVAEHGVDFFLNDQRRYRDLREGWVGALMRNIVDMPMVNNRQFLRTTLGKLGATFRADGTLTTPNSLFRQTQRIPMVTELIRKYNRQMEGLSADQMKKKFPVSESEVIPVDISGADLAKNPELVELIRAGTFLKVDDDGVIRSNKAMSPAEIKKYNKQFADSILEEVNKIDADEGLPEGHIKETKNEKTGETSFAGRFIDERVIDRLEQKGGWNKAQIDLLRQLNATLKGGEGRGTDWLMSYFKATKKGKYVNAKVENQVHIPYGIEITQKGNILIRTISQKQLDRNINKAFRQHKAEVTRLYGADIDKAMDSFHADMHLWSRNHAEGKMGKDGLDPDPQIAEAKANFINSMFGKSSKAHVDANPWLEQLDGGKKSPTPTYRSLRLERIGKANQLTGKIHIDHNKIAKNLMPKPVDLDALLAQNPQMRSTDPNYMPKFMYTPAEFTGANPKKTPSDFQRSFDILKFEQGGKFFDTDTKQDITNKTYDGMSISTLKNRPEAETSDVPAELPVGHSSKVGSDIKINMVNGKAGSTKFKWMNDKGDWDTKRQENESWLVSIENSSLDGNGRKVPEGGKDTDHVFARELISEVPTKLATYPKSKSNPRGRPTAKGDIVTGNVVGTMRMGKYNHFVYDKVTIVPKGESANYMPPKDFGILGNVENGELLYSDSGDLGMMNHREPIGAPPRGNPWRYNAEEKTVYWWEGMPSRIDKDTVTAHLERKGYEVVRNKHLNPNSDTFKKDYESAHTFPLKMPKFKGASDDIPKIIEDIDIATNIFSKAPAFGHAFDRSWHINTLVKRVIMNAENDFLKRRLRNAKERKDAYSIERGRGALDKADQYFYYMKYPLQDLVASLPDIKSQDIKKGLNSARNADPFEPIRDNFQGGTKRPLQDILQEMANVHEKIYPDETSTLNEIRGIGEILKDDYGVEIEESFLDDLYRRYRNLTKEEHEQFKAEEQKTLNELFNPEFNDIQDLGGGTKFIKPIDPDKNFMPSADRKPSNGFVGYFHELDGMEGSWGRLDRIKHDSDSDRFGRVPFRYVEDTKTIHWWEKPTQEAKDFVQAEIEAKGYKVDHQRKVSMGIGSESQFNEMHGLPDTDSMGKPKWFMPSADRKPVTFSARPEEIITLDSENIKNFMPAHKNVRLEDYLDYPIFALASDRVGVGTMLVGTNDYKIPVDFDAQGGRGFMYLYEDGGWAFKESGTAQTFLSRVAEVAGDRDEVLVGITVLSEINHLNSVFGQLSLAQAYEAALRSGHISKDQMRDHLQSVMTKVAIQKYGKDVFYTKDDPKKGIKKGDIKHREGEFKISKKYRDMLLSIDSVDEYKNQILKKQFPFSVHSEIVKRNNLAETAKDKAKGVTLPIKGKQAKELGLEMQSIANDIIDPQLRGLPVGQVVALLKVPVNQKPKKVDFHLSYPWQIKGEAIGFLDQFKALKDLTSNKKVFDKYGNVGGQPLQTVMPVFDKLNPTLYMPNFKPMLNGKKDNIKADVLGGIKQDKFSPQQFKAKLNEVKGAKEMAEDLGLLDFLEGKKSVTKDEIVDYIDEHASDIALDKSSGGKQYEDAQMEGGLYDNYETFLHEVRHSERYRLGDTSGGHWQNDRVLMHVRKTDRMVDDGSETWNPNSFHIEEMQSDWHQYGRKLGYADPDKLREAFGFIKKHSDLRKEEDIQSDIIVKEKFKDDIDQFLTNYEREIGRLIDSALMIRYGEVGQRMSQDKKMKFYEQATTYDYYNVQETEATLMELFSTFKRKSKQRSDELLPNGTKYTVEKKKLQEFYMLDKEMREALKDGEAMAQILGTFQTLRQTIDKQIGDDLIDLKKEISLYENVARNSERQIQQGDYGQAPAPYKNSWQSVAFTDAVITAIESGKSYITWTTGDRAASMANLDNSFQSVKVRHTKPKFLNDNGSNKYAVNATDIHGASIRKSVSEKELYEMIGKDYADIAVEKLGKKDQEVELTDVLVPHKGRRLLYDKIIPSVAKRVAKTLGVRPPIKSKIILEQNAIVPKYGEKAKHKTQEVWLMELPKTFEKIHELPLYMPSLMPQQNIPQANTNIMNRLQNNYFTMPKMRVGASKASQARDLEPENSYFNN